MQIIFLLILLIIQIVVHKNSPRKNALSACKTSPKGITTQFSSYVNVEGGIFNHPWKLITKVITLNNMLSVTSDSILGYDLQILGNILQVLQPFSIFSYIIGVIYIYRYGSGTLRCFGLEYLLHLSMVLPKGFGCLLFVVCFFILVLNVPIR